MTNLPGNPPRFSPGTSGSGSKRNYHMRMTPGLMEASFSMYNGQEKRSMQLMPGQRVRMVLVRQLTAGSIRIEVIAPDGTLALQLIGTSSEEGTFTAAIGGKYTVHVIAGRAAGMYQLEPHEG